MVNLIALLKMSEEILSKRALSIEPSLTLQISAKAKQFEKDGKDICNLSAGEPDFEAPKEVIEATSQAIHNGHTKYGPASGDIELRKAIAYKLNTQNKIIVSHNNVMVTNGAKQAIYNLFQIMLDEGDEVIIPAPYWLSYPQMVKISGGIPLIVDSTPEDGFKLNINKIKSKLSSKTKFLIINSPNNPTGKVLNRDEFNEIIQILRSNEHLNILSDEIYEFILKKEFKHESLASLADDLKDRIFTINGFAKGWAMTGWRVGYLVGREDVIKSSSALQSQSTSNVCSFAQRGAIAALQINGKFFDQLNAKYDERRNVLIKGIQKINGLYIYPPEGAFYAFPKLPNKSISSVEFCNRAIDDFGLVVVPGKVFGNDQCIRISCAASIDKIIDGLSRLEKAVKKYY